MSKTITLEEYVKEDGKMMEEYLYRDGEVPPVIFFHFPKINRKIANMMNQIPAGKMNVKNGFFIALNDRRLMESRGEFLHYMGSILAALEKLNVLEAPEAVVFCAEGWASTTDNKGKLPKRPSKDPEAKDVFIASGINKEGEFIVDVKEKVMKMVKVEGGKAIKPELIPMMDNSAGDAYSPLLADFFKGYTKALADPDKGWQMFSKMAEEDPIDAFRQGVAAAITLTRNNS